MFPYLVAALAVSMYGLLSPLAKKMGAEFPSFTFIALSSLILGSISTCIAFLFERGKLLEISGHVDFKWLAIFSIVNLVGYVGYIWAIQRVPVVHYEMFLFISPIVGGLFAMYLLNEPFHSRYLVALVFVMVGLAIAIKPWDVK